MPLIFDVAIEFEAKKPGDGAPTVHYEFRLENSTSDAIYLDGYSFFWDTRLVSLIPSNMFHVEDDGRHPLVTRRQRPPTKSDVWKVEPAATNTVRRWAWSGRFFVDRSQKQLEGDGRFFTYRQTKPGTARFRYCYLARRSKVTRYLPDGQRPFDVTEPICADEVAVDLGSLRQTSSAPARRKQKPTKKAGSGRLPRYLKPGGEF
ncbi:hypothetical protein ACFL6C_13950 [Myxococcota bacterium]